MSTILFALTRDTLGRYHPFVTSSPPPASPATSASASLPSCPELAQTHVLFSTQSALAIEINEKHYKNRHYVFVAPFFADRGRRIPQPASSCPAVLFRDFSEAVQRDDPSAAVIKVNKIGLKLGVAEKLKAGVIDSTVADAINQFIDKASAKCFSPLVLVIPVHLVASMLERSGSALATSEYLIRDLGSDQFQAMEFFQ